MLSPTRRTGHNVCKIFFLWQHDSFDEFSQMGIVYGCFSSILKWHERSGCPCKAKPVTTWSWFYFSSIHVRLVIWSISNLDSIPRYLACLTSVQNLQMLLLCVGSKSQNLFSLRPIHFIDWRFAGQNKLLPVPKYFARAAIRCSVEPHCSGV